MVGCTVPGVVGKSLALGGKKGKLLPPAAEDELVTRRERTRPG
jgi:hypothetical protein